METRKRFHYLDLLKLTAVVSVCALHFPWVGDVAFAPQMESDAALRRFFYAFYACAVPLFMMVNGALLLNGSFDIKKHYKGLLRIFLQYVFWRAVSIVLIGLYQGFDFSAWNLTEFVNVLVLMKDVEGISLSHLWFMPMLICLYIWVPLLKGAWDSEQGEKLFIPFLVFLLIFCFALDDLLLFQPVIPLVKAANVKSLRIFQPLSSSLYCAMLFYFILGAFLHKYSRRLEKISPALWCAGILAALALLYLEWRVNSNLMGETYDNVFASYDNLPDVILSACVFMLCLRMEQGLSHRPGLCRLMGAVSSESLSVYYFHWILLSTVFEKLHVADGYFFNVLRSVVLCLLCTAISLAIKRIPVLRRLVH